MADIQILDNFCDDEGEGEGERGERGERGKRGERGHRGHRGHDGHDGHDGATGPTGPTGPTGSTGATGATGPVSPTNGGLLKFSGVAAPAVDGAVVSFLTDFGVGLGAAGIISTSPSYPFAVQHNVRNMAVRALSPIIGTPGGAVTFELLRNGNPVPGFVVIFTVGGPIGNQLVLAGPVTFFEGDRLDLRATAVGVTVAVDVSATVGVE